MRREQCVFLTRSRPKRRKPQPIVEHFAASQRLAVPRPKTRNCFVRVNTRYYGKFMRRVDVGEEIESSRNLLAAADFAQRIQVAHHRLLVRVEPLHKPRIVQRGLLLGGSHSLQPPPVRRSRARVAPAASPPARNNVIPEVLALLRASVCSSIRSVASDASCCSGVRLFQFCRFWRICAWRSGGRFLKLLVILHEALLLVRRHVPQILDPLRRKPRHRPRIRLARSAISLAARAPFSLALRLCATAAACRRASPRPPSLPVLRLGRLRRQPHKEPGGDRENGNPSSQLKSSLSSANLVIALVALLRLPSGCVEPASPFPPANRTSSGRRNSRARPDS